MAKETDAHRTILTDRLNIPSLHHPLSSPISTPSSMQTACPSYRLPMGRFLCRGRSVARPIYEYAYHPPSWTITILDQDLYWIIDATYHCIYTRSILVFTGYPGATLLSLIFRLRVLSMRTCRRVSGTTATTMKIGTGYDTQTLGMDISTRNYGHEESK